MRRRRRKIMMRMVITVTSLNVISELVCILAYTVLCNLMEGCVLKI